MITTLAFWKGAFERLLKTFIQAFLAAALVGGVDDIAGIGLTDLNWLGSVNIAGLAAFISLCTSVLNATFVAGVPMVPATVVDAAGNIVGDRAPALPPQEQAPGRAMIGEKGPEL
jgi:hypothetical protein